MPLRKPSFLLKIRQDECMLRIHFLFILFLGLARKASVEARRSSNDNELIAFEGEAKSSNVRSVMKWWSKCISMAISKTASKNVTFTGGWIVLHRYR